VLVDQLFGGRDRDLPGRGKLVVFQGGTAQLGAFFFGLFRFRRAFLSPAQAASGVAGPPVLSGWGGRL
jgi:hypothetical protein